MEVCKMIEDYATEEQYAHLVGQRARIPQPIDYCEFLWGQKGVLSIVNGKLFLEFDTPAVRHLEDTMSMSGVYLKPYAFTLEVS